MRQVYYNLASKTTNRIGSRKMLPRGRTYGPEVDDALRVISESLDYICADRLTPNLVWMATHLAAHSEVDTSPLLLEQLERTCGGVGPQLPGDARRFPLHRGPFALPDTQNSPRQRRRVPQSPHGTLLGDLVQGVILSRCPSGRQNRRESGMFAPGWPGDGFPDATTR